VLVYVAIAALFLASLAGTAYPLAAAAPAGIVLTSSAQITFPTALTFKVHAQSDANLTQLRVHYKVDRQNVASVTSEGWAQFNPAATVDGQWLWDMRKSSLPPGAQVEYWWTALDSAGKTAQTPPATVVFNDDRHRWQTVTSGPITLEWYNGSQSFANSLLNAGVQGLQRIESDTGAIPQGQVLIYIYASAQDLQSAQLFAQQWEGGVTFPGYSIIAVGVPTDQLSYGQRAVPHELTHWIVGQITFNDFGAGLPTWLDEGLATYGEGTLSPDYQSALSSAIRNNQLISIRSLSSPFSAVSQVALTSYGESNSIVTFMINTYGKAKMRELLGVFQQGSGYDEALMKVYGFDQDGLDSLWRKSLGLSSAIFPEPDLVIAAG
jgi:hypothetical protein